MPPEPARIDAICRFANAAGALAATGRGAIPSLPTRDAIERLMGGTQQSELR
jgi:fructokinase